MDIAYERMHQMLDDGDVDYVLTWCETIVVAVELIKHTRADALELHFGNLLTAKLITWRIYNELELNPTGEYAWCDICNWTYRRDEGSHLDCEQMYAHGEQHLMFGGIPLFREAPRFNKEYGRKAFLESSTSEDDGVVIDLDDFNEEPSPPQEPHWYLQLVASKDGCEGAKA